MPDDYIHELARKWLAGTATAEEINILMQWYGKEEMDLVRNEDNPRRRRLSSVWWMAAAVMIAAGIWALYPKKAEKKLVVYVPREQQNKIVLPDSSIVWLNADSKLQYNDGPQSREVTLSGEAFFDVKKAARPFVVKAGGSTTTVLGTRFNIKAYSGEPTAITVASGKIRVEDERKHITILTANKQITLKETTDSTAERTVNATVYHAWIQGGFEVNNETFESVANMLSRKYNVAFHFENDALKKCTFIASFDEHTPMDRILELLCKINNSTFRISQDKKEVYISGEGCQ
ncbi:FecR family protein [Chitinophaga filiformis]|uniref:FecR protein n=1 Tax=Chitinophaga filiformis TaxID=104663 RepID=A0A1G7HCR2_CHIFI|nr:FecR family protein [Chitinophaga filiformis]SDE97849.1 FecR protein [Chitinophaga filiformis]